MTIEQDPAGPIKMAKFQMGQVCLEIPAGMLNQPLRRQLRRGHYEHVERKALRNHLEPGDRILELGGGVGYLAAVAGTVLPGEAITVVEANPDLIPVIKANLALNSVIGAKVVHGAVAGPDSAETVTFHLTRAFWASSASGRGFAGERTVTVSALKLPALLKAHDPSVLVVDVEGAEEDLFDHPMPPRLRIIVMELHPKAFSSPHGVGQIFSRLAAAGFDYQPVGSSGHVVCFGRTKHR